MPPILIFKFGSIEVQDMQLQELHDFSKYATDTRFRFKYDATAVIVKVFDMDLISSSYVTFVKRNRMTEDGEIKMDWLRYSKDSMSVSSWSEVVNAGITEVAMYKRLQ